MKLHLPKPLRNSVLACIAAVAGIATPTLGTATFAGGVVAFTLASQQAMAVTYLEANDSLYYIGGTTQNHLNSETITGVTVETPEGGKRTTVIEEIDASGMTTVNIAADSNQNVWTNAGIGLLKAQSGATIDVKVSGWDGNRYFDALLIEELEVAESGTVNINVSKAEHTVVLNSLDGTLGTAALTGTLTIGFDASFATANSVSGTGTLSVVNGATATINTTGGTSGVTSNVQVGAGSKLVLAQGDALGWDNSSTKSITLIGTGTDEAGQAKLEMSGKQTMTTNLNLSGNGLVTGGQLEFYGGRITATGTNNVIASDIYCRGGQNGIIAVTGETDILEITGTVKKGSQGEGPITKEGEGKLILSGADNIFYQDFAVKGGTVTLSNTTTMNGSLTLHDGATLETTVDSAITFGSNFKIDVSNLTAIAGEGNVMKYTILTGSGNKSLETLNAGNISGIVTMGKIWTFGSDGSVSYVVTTKDLVWDGTSGSVATWSTSGTQFSSGGEFANGDNVTFAASASVSVAQGGVQALNMIVQGEGTHVKLMTGEGIALGEGLKVKDGAILELATSSNDVGVLRGVVTVEDGGTLRFSAKDVTGWGDSGNTTHTINVLAGGTLEMAHANNETFRGTLNLDGSMKGTAANSSLWDLFGGNATINVSAGATAKMENMSLNLRQDNSVVTVGEGGSLTIEKGIKKGDAGNAVVIKEGAGALIVQGESTNSGFTVNGGSVEMANANDLTMSISGVAGTSFTKNGAGIINMGNIKDYSYAGEMIVNDGEIKFTSDATENGAAQPGFVKLYNNLVTTEDSKAVVEGDVSINYQAQDAQSCTATLNGNLEVTGGLSLNSYGSGNAPDGDSMRRWNIESDGSLTVGGVFSLTNKQKMVVSGGDLVAAGGIILGHGDNGAGGAYKAKLQLDSGSVTTSGIEFKGGHNSMVMNGGTLEFTSGDAFTGGAENNSNQINLLGGTLKVGASDVNLTGSAQHNLTMGGVGIDVASGKTATLGGVINLSSTIAKTGTGTLKLDSGLVLSVDDYAAFERGDSSTFTDFDGSTTSGNGFFSGSILLIEGDYNKAGSITVQVGGTAVTNYVEDSTGLGVSVTDNSTYFVNTGTVTLTESKAVSAFYIASGAVLAYEAGGFTATLSGSGTYRPASVMQATSGAYMTPGITLDSDWTGIVEINNSHIQGVNFNSLGTAQSSVKLVGLSTWIDTSHTNIVTNLILENHSEERAAFIIADSSMNKEYRFKGSVSGTGDFEVATRASSYATYAFEGDTSKWSGNIFVSTSYNNEVIYPNDERNNTPNLAVQLTGGGNIFTTDGDSVILMNRAGTLDLSVGSSTKDSVLNAQIGLTAGTLNLNAGSVGSTTTFAKDVNVSNLTVKASSVFLDSVNASRLVVNGGTADLYKNLTLSGNIAFTNHADNHLVLRGDNNVVNVIDLSNSNNAVGLLELKSGANLTSRNTLWMRPDASILLEEDASVIWKESMVTGKTGTKAEIITSQDASQELHQSYLTIKNADCTVSGSASRTVAALLQNSSVINASTGLVTVTNAGNTLTGVEAKTGNIAVQNTTTGSLVGLGAITAADYLSVSADMQSAQVSAITLGTEATFSTTGALTVADGSALSLGTDAGISMNGALTLGSGLVLTVSDVSKDTILFSGVTSIATSLDDITAYISSINGLTDLSDYTLELDGTKLVLVVDKGKIVTWDAANTTWKDSAQFGATAEDTDVFINGDMVVFGNLAADEAVTIEGGVHAADMVVDATAGKTYTFTAAADGGTLTVPTLSINSGKAVFGVNTIQLDSLTTVVVGNNGELDLSAYAAGTTLEKMLGIASGGGLIKLAGGEIVSGDEGAGDENRLILKNLGSAKQTVMDYEIDGSLAMNGWEQGDKLLTIATDFAVAEELRLESAAKVTVAAGGHLITDKGNTSDTDCISLGYMNDDSGVVLAMTGGKITTGTIKITQGGTHEFRMDGGTLEITSNAGIASGVSTTITGGTLVADKASWGITGATIGGATVTDGTLNCAVQIQTTGDNTITLTNAKLTGTLDNAAGTLVLAGVVTINGSGFNKQETLDDFSNGGTDGFATTDTYYQLVTTAGNLSIADDTTWTMGKYVATGDKAGWVRVDGTEYGNVYYLNTADTSTALSTIKTHAGTTYTLSSVALNGGNLEYDVTDAAVDINVQESGIIKITDADTTDTTEVVLSSSKVTVASGKTVTLTGNGVYDIGSTALGIDDETVVNAVKVSGLKDAANWTGTVVVKDSVGNANKLGLNELGNANSTVKLVNTQGYLWSGSGSYTLASVNTNVILADSDNDYNAALTIANGSTDQTDTNKVMSTFTKKVSGTGNMVFEWSKNAYTGIAFTGDVSEWTGAFIVTAANDTPTANVENGHVNLKFSGDANVIKADLKRSAADRQQLMVYLDDAGATDTTAGITMHGSIEATSLTLGLAADTADSRATVKLNNSVTVDTLTNYAATTVNGTLAAGAAVTNNGTLELTQNAATLASLAGTGSVTAKSLTLTGADNAISSLTLSTGLTLGVASAGDDAGVVSSLAVTTLTVDNTNKMGLVTINNLNAATRTTPAILKAGSLAGSLTFAFDDALLEEMVGATDTKSLVLMEITDGKAADTELLLKAFGDSTDAAATNQISRDQRYTYSLKWDAATNQLKLEAQLCGAYWLGMNDLEDPALWTENSSWVTSVGEPVPVGGAPSDTVAAVLSGRGDSTIFVKGAADTLSLTVDVWTANREAYDLQSYNGSGFFTPAGVEDKLTIEKNLVVNAGALNVKVDTEVKGDLVVKSNGRFFNHDGDKREDEATSLQVKGNLDNAGTLFKNHMGATLTVEGKATNSGTLANGTALTGQETTAGSGDAIITIAGQLTNTGAITNGEAGKLTIGSITGYDPEGSDIVNTGVITNAGTLAAARDMANSGVYTQTDGSLYVGGNLTNTGVASKENSAAGMNITGGKVTVGTMTNNGTLNLSDASLELNGYSYTAAPGPVSTLKPIVQAAELVNTGTMNITNGAQVTVNTITVGKQTAVGTVTNTGEIKVTEGSLTTSTMDNDGTLTIGGAKDAEGNVLASVKVTGGLDNTAGNIVIGSAATETDKATYGSLSVGGNLTHAGNGNIVVNSGSSLDVKGDLAANGMTLDFDGVVTVGGNAVVNNLTNDGTFTADNATIGKLTNNGTLSVGEVGAGGNLIGGKLTITTLTGTGAVNVGKDGSLTITDAAEFSGQLNNQGKLELKGATLSAAQAEGATAGNITTEIVTVKSTATGYNGGSYVMGDIKTDALVIEDIDAADTAARLDMNSLAAKTDGGVVSITISDADMADVVATGKAGRYDLISVGTIGSGLNLTNNDDLTTDLMQTLLANGLTMELLPTEAAANAAMATADKTMVTLNVREQTADESIWNFDGAKNTTEAGLIVLKDDKLASNVVLDKVQTVKVTDSQSLDLTGDISKVTLNSLTAVNADSSVAQKLTITGDAGDTATVTTAASGYAGTVVLDKVTGNVSGQLDTVKLTNKAAANLAVTNTDVEALTSGLTLNGSMKGGELSISKADGVKGTLKIDGTDLNIAYDDKGALSMSIAKVATTGHVLVNMDKITGEAGDIFIGKDGKASKLMEKYYTNVRFEDNKGVVADRNTVYYTSKLADKGTSDNGKAGLAMADESLLSYNPQGASSTGDLAAVLDQLDAYVASGNKAGADKLGASLAGASTAVLGMAAMGDVDRQLRAIRNRTTTMGVDQSVVNADMPYFNAWINAEGDSREMGEDETLGGYKLNSYGGTVGFDVDIEPTFTAGMALTAMYGDLDTTGADKATGNLDSYYVSAFARYCGSAWTHTFVGTIGMSDISLDRTVGTAQVQGETDAMSFGLMYEVGRVYAMDEDGTTCLQPVFNVTWKHTTVDAYTEKGGDVALKVDEQSLDTITFGLGARLQTVVGESMYNRTSIFECRLLAKADAGDTEGTSKVALGSSATHEVKSNEMGAVGIELGAGLTIPLGDEGSSIFMDASAEIRADYTEVNGTVGYRVNF